MVITASADKGIRCQVSDFVLAVDPEKNVSATVILRTKTEAPIAESAFPENVIAGAGEYEISGVKTLGFQLQKESSAKEIRTAYAVSMDEIRMCFLGNHLRDDLSEEALDGFGDVDILFLPEPAKEFDGKKIAGLVKQIEPRVMIAMAGKETDQLAKDLGQKPEKMEKFVTKKKELMEMNTKLIVISL